MNPRQTCTLSIALCALLLTVSVCQAQVASALFREGEALPGGNPGELVTGIGNSAQNGVGGIAFTATTDAAGATINNVWGSATGGPSSVLVTESTIGTLEQTSIESFFGLSDSGSVAYSAGSNDTSPGGSTGLDGVWIDSTVILNEEDPITALPGNFSTFNSRPGITRGGTAYWVGGYSTIQGGGSMDRALFLDGNVLLKGNDVIPGVAEPVTFGGGIDFDFRFSANATNYISPIDLQAASSEDIVIVVNGAALTSGGGVIREDSPIPVSIGGLAGENYDNFDFVGITESGEYMITGDSNGATATDEFVMVNGQIVMREGDMIGADTINGAIEGGFMNEDGDWAVVWDVDRGGSNIEALILNGEIVLAEDDLVDWNGDGVIDGSDQNGFLTNFTGINSLTLSDRDANGMVNLAFTADIDVNGTILEGAFGYSVTVVPEPSSLLLIGLGAALTITRRRRNK